MVSYSIAIRKSHPGDENSTETKAYGVVQINETLSIEQFSKHIAEHGSVYSRDIIQGVILKMVDCLREMLLEGKKVQLGDLRSFGLSLNTTGARTASQFTADNITKVNVVWTPGKEFRNLREDAEFQLVPGRKAQAEAVAEAKLQATHV